MNRWHILAVEDEPDFARLIEKFIALKLANFTITHCQTLRDAIGIIKTHPIDVVLLDLSLPDSSGLEGVATLRKLNECLPIIVLTSATEEVTALAALQAGAEDYLNKGDINPAWLVRSIRYAAERKSIEQKLFNHQKLLREKDEIFHRSQKLEAVGTLVAGVAHEFNNLLQVIIGGISLVQETPSLDRQSQEDLGDALAAAEHAATITRQLLDFSAQANIKIVRINVADSVLKTAALIQTLLDSEYVLEVTDIDRSLEINGDVNQLNQVFINLCINSRDAMPHGGSIRISAEAVDIDEGGATLRPTPNLPVGKYVKFSVRDTGTGIPMDVQPRIFEPFFTTKEIGCGTGLGLAAVHGIVAQHGGWIGFETKEGVGTDFTFYLPAVVKDTTQQSCVNSNVDLSGGETILIADDDAGVQMIIDKILRSEGYQTVLAGNGSEAIQKYSDYKHLIDLVILDEKMPKVRGHEVYQRIREDSPSVPILFCTGCCPEISEGFRLDQQDAIYMPKPISRKELLRRVRDALGYNSFVAC